MASIRWGPATMSSVRWDTPARLEVIDKSDTVFENSRRASKRLFVILFNEEFPEQGGIESRFKKWQKVYETIYNVVFYKCIITEYEQVMKNQFNIQDTPTLVFIRNGAEIGRIEDLTESNPNKVDQTGIDEESEDERRVKQRLDELCKNSH